MERAAKRQRLSHLLALQNSNSAWRVQRLLKHGNADPAQSGAWKKQTKAILQPAENCYVELCVPAKDGGDSIRFWRADIAKVLAYVAGSADFYRQRLAALQDDVLSIVLVEDEATGGNVLSTSSSKKMHLWYFCVKDAGDLHRPDAWFPLACIPSRDVTLVEGTTSQVGAAVLRHLASQHLGQGVNVCGLVLRLRIHAFLADYDALNGLISAKSASALKPCFLCKNIVSKQHGSTVVSQDPYFQSISVDDPNKFDLHTPDELHDVYERTLRDMASSSAAQRRELETCFGYSVHKNAVLACPIARSLISVDSIMFDSMLQYFANGVCSSEMLAFQERFAKVTGVKLEHLQRSVREVPWVCRDKSFRSPSARSWLFNETFWQGGQNYKGSASQTYMALPLLVHYANKLSVESDLPELASLNALYETVLELKKWRRGHGNVATLDACQRKHQIVFMQHYAGQERPKHHYRLHLREQYARLGYCDLWPCEARHKAYKHSLADEMSGVIVSRSGKSSKHILTRLLHRLGWSLNEHEWVNQLAGVIHDQKAVEQSTGLNNCRISTAFQLQSLHLQSDDIVLFDDQTCWVHFFVEEADGTSCVMENLNETPQDCPFARSFSRTGRKVARCMKELFHLHQPVWWHVDGDNVLCLL